MKPQKLFSYARKAIQDYDMISPGDKIAIGISGGKDSLTLLYAMAKLKHFYPIPYDLVAITVDLGFPDFETSQLSDFAKSFNVPYHVEKTEIAKIVFDLKQEEHPCSLCSRLRKGAFNEAALQFGCNKIAYAHHKDDVINSFLMSMLYEGRLHTFSPVTHLERSHLHLIRPLIYIREGEIISFAKEQQLPIKKNPCPADGVTKRQEAKELIQQLSQTVPETKERIFSSITGSGIDGW